MEIFLSRKTFESHWDQFPRTKISAVLLFLEFIVKWDSWKCLLNCILFLTVRISVVSCGRSFLQLKLINIVLKSTIRKKNGKSDHSIECIAHIHEEDQSKLSLLLTDLQELWLESRNYNLLLSTATEKSRDSISLKNKLMHLKILIILFLKNKFLFLIGGLFLYNVLISLVQQRKSAINIHILPPSPLPSTPRELSLVLCDDLGGDFFFLNCNIYVILNFFTGMAIIQPCIYYTAMSILWNLMKEHFHCASILVITIYYFIS